MADLCETSLTATAIRYAELSSDAVAVIVSMGKVIDYCIMSDAMKSLPQLTWLRKGSPVPGHTETGRLNANPHSVLEGEHASAEIDVMDWLGGTRSAIVTEDVVGLGRYGKTLTVLSSVAIGQEDDEETEEDTFDRWEPPRFRR
jgi:hypothetical protein